MPFVRPTRQRLLDQTSGELATRLGLDAVLPRGMLAAHAAVVAGQAHMLHGHLVYLTRQVVPDTADSAHLERFASRYGIFRKAASKAKGTTRFTGTESTAIPAATRVRRTDASEYETDAAATIVGGLADVAITARIGGETTDAAAGTLLTLVSPIAGIDGSTTVQAPGLSGGSDAETDKALLARLLARIQSAPQGGALADYVTWALAASTEVTRAWSIALHLGDGTVGVTFAVDNDVGGPVPDAAQLATVAAYIAPRRPATADVTVFAFGEKKIDPTIVLVPDTTPVRAAVQTNLEDMLKAAAAPGKTITVGQIREAISTAPGETSHALTLPVADVTALAGEIVTLGTITWA